MTALLFERNLARFAASRVAATVAGSGRGARVGPLRLTDLDAPELPGDDWLRLRPTLAGICGSDLATLDGHSSRYFEDLVSFPFVPGHEIVGFVDDDSTPSGSTRGRNAGTRMVVEPVLGCIPRGIVPLCRGCSTGDTGRCEHVAFGHLSPGLQIGYCCDTGGGWSQSGLVAHPTQLHAVPAEMSDEEAVMVEPTACAVHAALAARVVPGEDVAVIGAGTLGLATVAALRQLAEPSAILVAARYPHQRRLALDLGADVAVEPDQLARRVRRRTGSLRTADRLTGGASAVIDCVGSAESLTLALSMVRPRGRIVLVGMPGKVHIDLASLWHREVELAGAYAYGMERVGDNPPRRTFELAMEVVATSQLGRLVSARFPLERFEEAIALAGSAGRRGVTKVVFDLHAGSKHAKGPTS